MLLSEAGALVQVINTIYLRNLIKCLNTALFFYLWSLFKAIVQLLFITDDCGAEYFVNSRLMSASHFTGVLLLLVLYLCGPNVKKYCSKNQFCYHSHYNTF